jgi:hypothetical protein
MKKIFVLQKIIIYGISTDDIFRGYGDETKGDETKIRKLWRNASHISFVESNNFRNFPRSGMGNKTKIK